MERQEISAISIEDLKQFLSEEGLSDSFARGDIKCVICDRPVTFDNVAAIIKKGDGYAFQCNSPDCSVRK